MSNIIPFESGNLPAYMKSVNVAEINSDLTSHAGTGFPVISIKGKVFAVVRDGERTVLPNPKDPDSPATAIEVVMVKANKGTSKVFYAKGYQEGAENTKPDCFSNTGDKPDASVEAPQCKSCAACPHNQWGSKIGENGGKGKACQDSVRLAISTPGLINDPYLLRVPPASIKALGEYGKMLAKRGVGYNMVVTKIGFDMEAPTPKLTFKAIGFMDDATFAQVNEVANGDVVAAILGAAPADVPEIPGTPPTAAAAPAPAAAPAKAPAPSKSKTVTDEEVDGAVAAAASAKPAKAPAKVETPDLDVKVDLNLDDLSFDD
jgi:hypothetical protein